MTDNKYKDIRLTLSLEIANKTLENKEEYPVGVKLPPDNIVATICEKHNLPSDTIMKLTMCNDIPVYAIIVLPDINDKEIIADMEKMGYFVSCGSPLKRINGVKYKVIKFEPKTELQDDKTEEIKLKYKMLFHWCLLNNLDRIMKDGLLPKHNNRKFNYPNRIYLMKGGIDRKKMKSLGKFLYRNNNFMNNGNYVLLKVDIRNVSEEVRFYYDPCTDIGIYTEQPIPKEYITIVEKCNFSKRHGLIKD